MTKAHSDFDAFTRAAWLREATRHQNNAAYFGMMARGLRDIGDVLRASDMQRAEAAAAYNARCNLFAALNILVAS